MDIRIEFARGIEAYQAKNFELARDQFQKVAQESPADPAVQLNLALAYNELKNPYLAVAHLRVAEELAGHTTQSKTVAQSLQSESGRNLLEETQNFSFTQALNQKLLMDVSIWSLSALSSLLLFATIYFWLRKKIENRSAVFYPVVFTLLTVICVALSATKFALQQEQHGTVIEKDAPLYVEASADSPQLLTVPQGQYVLIEESKPDWYRIEIDGVGEGFMKANQLFVREKM